MQKPISTTQAAQMLGVSTRRVIALIHSGRLRAKKFGRDWMIRTADLDKIWESRDRTAGRPPKGGKHDTQTFQQNGRDSSTESSEEGDERVVALDSDS
jgi:excisionase family DNA binding protein